MTSKSIHRCHSTRYLIHSGSLLFSCYLCKLNHPSTSKLRMVEIFLPSTQYSIYIRYIAGETMVLLMGSGSWPPFTSKIHKINSLVSSFDKLKWVMVYIAEAHASDSNWPIDNNYMSPKQHTQLQVTAAHRLMFIQTAVHMRNQSNILWGHEIQAMYSERSRAELFNVFVVVLTWVMVADMGCPSPPIWPDLLQMWYDEKLSSFHQVISCSATTSEVKSIHCLEFLAN